MTELHSTLIATTEQRSIARALLYQSARALMMNSQNYDAYLQSLVEINPFLEYIDHSNDSLHNAYRDLPASFIEDVPQPQGLHDVLLEQWLCVANDESRFLGELIISNLTPQGFHHFPLSTFVTKDISLHTLLRVASHISRLVPVGCATEDWVESLWVQSQEQPLHAEWSTIDILTFRRAMQLWEHIGYNLETEYLLKCESESELRSYLQHFTPYPGLQYGAVSTIYNKADLLLQRVPDGKLQVVLHTYEGVLQLNDTAYQQLLGQMESNPEGLKWLREQWRKAGDIIAMHQYRNMQLLRVSSYIVEYQRDFFQNHHHGLKALQLKDVADALQISQATVSRTIHHKWLATDQGLILLKKLLSRKQQHGSQVYSRQTIKNKVREIIYQYGKVRVSDEKIRRLLLMDGIAIARRTINKYRHEDGL
ncbi:hypothetical protein PVA44_00755 [Entomospira nematocerorum]|uniref:RNA polymerase sigma-54 factor n=1 Tax=Entomospira nematocerorum TaxID=2719987 RepID=A0A968KVL2_9SPIO|nr:hypothetical protein [Entomospira nematocera]NIZ47433.1 hypothetical protein [Entomospira nematocera]WDI34029.1 hypothetical protein PVA44_00755 [Entomospira nematocera]